MRVSGQRIIVFGDSLSKHGHDSSPEIWDVNQGSNRPSSSPGDLLASMLAEQGAQAVRVNARVSRSAWNFFQRENSAQLLAADAHFKPTRVVIMLGTNDVGLNQIQDREAFTKLRDSYLAMGAEVWAVGPFANTSLDQAGVVRVVQTMRGVFGRQFIDGREISLIVKPGRDGVHYDQIGARQLAIAIAGALAGRMATNTIWATAGFSLLGVGLAVIAAMAYRRYGGKQLGLAAGDDDDSDDDWGSDAWQAKHDAKRERETKKISAALKTSPALIASTGHREHLVIVGGDPSEPGKLRASQFADDGPLGHETRANQDEIIESIRQSYRSVRPATDDEVIAWTSSEKFVEGSKRVAFTQAANMLNWRAGQKDKRDQAREIETRAHKLAHDGDWDGAVSALQQGIKDLGGAKEDAAEAARMRAVAASSAKIWRYSSTTGLWSHEKNVAPEHADQWLEILRRDEPNVTFTIAKHKPKKAPKLDGIGALSRKDEKELQALIKQPGVEVLDVAQDKLLENGERVSTFAKTGGELGPHSKSYFQLDLGRDKINWWIERKGMNRCSANFRVFNDGIMIGDGTEINAGGGREPKAFIENYGTESAEYCERAAASTAWQIAKTLKRMPGMPHGQTDNLILIKNAQNDVREAINRDKDHDHSEPEELYGLAASGEDVSVQDLFSDESPNAMQVAEDFILERGWKLTRGFIGGGRHYSIDMSTPSIGQRNLKRTNPEAAWTAEEVAEDRKLWKRAGASVETQPNDAGPGTYPGDQRITRTIALHAYNGNQEAVTREVKLNNVTIDEARKFAAAATWAMAKQIKPRELDTDVSDVVYETARILRAASRRKKLLQPSELFGLGRKITKADVVDAVTGLEGQTEDAISIALDMAEEGNHERADEILFQEASAVPTGLAPISQTIVAQCVRPISALDDEQVKQALYHVQSAGPEIGRHDGSPLSREPYVIVSASKRFASKHNVGETAVFPAKADSTRVPEDTEGHAVFPIVLVPRPIPDAVDDPDEEMAFVPRADFRYMFSHVEALRELAVTHIVPCEGVELFGLEGATNIVDGKRSNESEAAIIRSGARQVACKSGLDLKKLATCWTRKGALGKPQSMLKTIAAESQSADEFARRAEAWASSESNPPSDKAIAKLFKGASVAMIEQAREARQASTQARYKKLARGLRGDDRDQIIADAIKDSAERAGTWKGSRKVFVSDVFEQLRKDGRDDGFTLEEFKHELVRLHKAGKIKLARADLVAAMPANKVAQSEIDARGATFNFVQLDGLLGATVGETFKRNNSKTAYTVVEIVRPARSVGTLKIGETIRISHGDELIDVTDAGGTWLDDQGRKYKRTK